MNSEELDPNNVQHDPSECKFLMIFIYLRLLRTGYVIYINVM